MKHALLIALMLVAASGIVFAEPNATMSGGGDFSASAVLWFAGTNVTAQVSGNLTLTGELVVGGTESAFKAKGSLSGAASGDSNTMIGSGWATFVARGTLATGEEISMRGAIDLSTDDIDLSSDTAGNGTGSLYVVLSLPDRTLRMRGSATGMAGGAFVPPDDPNTMQLDGKGSFTFTIASRDASSGEGLGQEEDSQVSILSWDTQQWPDQLREQFRRMMQEESE